MVPFFRAVRGRERGVAKRPPPCGGEAPTKVAKRPFVGGGVPLRSPVFNGKVIQNMGRFERNLAEMVFGPCPTARVGGFAICVRMAELLSTEGEKIAVLAVFGDSKAI